MERALQQEQEREREQERDRKQEKGKAKKGQQLTWCSWRANEREMSNN